MSKIKKIVVSILAVIVLCPAVNASAEISAKQHECPDFSEISDMSFDVNFFNETIEKLAQIAQNPDYNRTNEVKMHLKNLVEQYIHMKTVFNICSINYYSDVSDDILNGKYMDIQNTYNEMYDNFSNCCADLYDAGFSNELSDVDGYDLTEIFLEDTDDNISDEEYEKIFNENNSLINEINSLTNQYHSYTEEDFIVEYKNQTWVLSDILNNPPADDNDYKAIAKLINNKKNDILGNVYLELIRKRNQVAKLYGYDNYAKYAYEKFYRRDYSPEDTDKIYTYVKEYFSGIGMYLSDEAEMSAMYSDIFDMDFSGEKTLNIAAEFFEQIDPEISERFDHLKSHHLYDLSMNAAKSGDSFMISLYDYNVPFLFISPQGNYYDLINVIHEFGHANAEYINPSSGIYDEKGSALDTSEMHSQGMEVLFTHFSEQILGEENGKAFNRIIISNLVDSILQGCLFDEFQKYAYMNSDCTLDDLNAEYQRLCREYGIEYYDDDPYTYDWVDISHNFTQPTYYVSYASSAVSVLDLWIKSMNDMDGAVENYKKITECDKYTSYMEATEECGLANLFDEDALAEIAYQTEYYFDNDTIDLSYKPYHTDNNAAEIIIPTQAENYFDKNSSLTEKRDLHDFNPIKFKREDNSYDKDSILINIISTFLPIILASAAYSIGLIITIIVIRKEKKKNKFQTNDQPPSEDE